MFSNLMWNFDSFFKSFSLAGAIFCITTWFHPTKTLATKHCHDHRTSHNSWSMPCSAISCGTSVLSSNLSAWLERFFASQHGFIPPKLWQPSIVMTTALVTALDPCHVQQSHVELRFFLQIFQLGWSDFLHHNMVSSHQNSGNQALSWPPH